MNGSVFFKGGYMNRVGFEILARTPVPKLPQSYRPLPHPKVWSECAIAVALLIPLWTVRLSKVNTISECSDQNVQLRRLTRVFACRTRHFVTSRDYRRYIWLAKALIRLLMCRFSVHADLTLYTNFIVGFAIHTLTRVVFVQTFTQHSE